MSPYERIEALRARASKSPSLVEDFRSEVVSVLFEHAGYIASHPRDRLIAAVEAYDDAKGGQR